jgi:hypothetical protein
MASNYWNSLNPNRRQQAPAMTGQPANQAPIQVNGNTNLRSYANQVNARGIGPSVTPSTGPGAATGGIPGVGSNGATAGVSAGGYGTNIRRAPIGGSQQTIPSGMRQAKQRPVSEPSYTESDFQSAVKSAVDAAMSAYAPNNQTNQNQANGTQPDYPSGDGGSNTGGNQYDAYGMFADAVGHEGTAKSGMNRDAYRDAWMGSGIGDSATMDAWLAQNGGQRLNDAGVVRTPFGEILDMGIGYKGGRGRAGWTNIGMNG